MMYSWSRGGSDGDGRDGKPVGDEERDDGAESESASVLSSEARMNEGAANSSIAEDGEYVCEGARARERACEARISLLEWTPIATDLRIYRTGASAVGVIVARSGRVRWEAWQARRFPQHRSAACRRRASEVGCLQLRGM